MTKNTRTEKNLEEMKQEIAKKSSEIKRLQKSMEDMKTQINGKETTGQAADVNKMVNDVSGLLNIGFGILGAPGKAQVEKSQGLVGLIDELGKLAEKSQTTEKTVNFGKHGVATFCVSSHSIKDNQASKPAGSLRISKPNKAVSKPSIAMPSTVGSIKEREPIVDVFEEEDCLRVTAELPGVQEKEISLLVDGKALVISAGANTNRAYYKRVELPAPVKKKMVERSYRNGILEAKLEKEKKAKLKLKAAKRSRVK